MPAKHQSGWSQLPLPLYEQVQLHLDERDRCLSLGVCKDWRAMSLELSQLWEVVRLIQNDEEDFLHRLCLPWLRWVAAWDRAGRAPPVKLQLDFTYAPSFYTAAEQDLLASLGFALGACQRSLACLSLQLPMHLYSGCAFLASLTDLLELKLVCHDVETDFFDAISHLTALTYLQVLINPSNEHEGMEYIDLPPKLVKLHLMNMLYAPLPSSVSALAELTELDLYGSNFADYQDWAREWEPTWAPPHLQVLSLQSCTLGQVPPWLTNLCSLRELDLSRNPLSEDWWAEAQPFSALSQLSKLNISGVHWGELPASLLAMTSLRQLSMAHSPARLKVGLYLQHLTSLVISWDQAKPPLSALPCATRLEFLELQRSREGPVSDHTVSSVLRYLSLLPALKHVSMEVKAVSWCLESLEKYSRVRSRRPELRITEILESS